MKSSIRKNDQIKLEITGLTAEGNGVGHFEGMAVFVSAAVPGDTLLVHIIKVSKSYAVGRIHQILIPAKTRVPSDCRVNASCGGCAYRQMAYEEELKGKWQRVADALQRIGHIELTPNAILHLESPNGYRNKAQYPVSMENSELKIGFYALRSHRVVDCRSCRLQPEEFEGGVAAFAKWILDKKISIYDEGTHTGLLRRLYFRKAFGTGELMACAVINGDRLPHADYLIGCLQNALPGLKSVAVNFNTERTNVILGRKTKILWGAETITDTLCGLSFRLSPNAFYQVNHDGAELLYAKAKEYAGLTGKETLLDLYCGAGTIGLTMAQNAGQLIGVELVEDAVKNARENAALNHIENARFLCGDAATAAEALKNEGTLPDVVIIDPPRKGCDPGLPELISSMNPKRVVYVSCDPATLARDLRLFEENGYEAKEITPVDMFPRTPHVECVVLIQKKNS